MFFTQLYIKWQYKYSHVRKKTLNEKKCLCLFNKNTPSYAGLGFKQKTFSNCQATYQKELCCLKMSECANVQRGLTPPPPPTPACFSLLFKNPTPTPHPSMMNVLFEWPLVPYWTIGLNGLKSQTSTKRIEIIETPCHRV